MMNASQTNTAVMKMHSASIPLEAITVFASQVILEMAQYAKVRYHLVDTPLEFFYYTFLQIECCSPQ